MPFLKVLLLVCLVFLAACQTVQVPIKHMASAERSIPADVKRIALFPYTYENHLNPSHSYLKDKLPDQVAHEITSYGTYGIAERAYIQTLMKEAMVSAGAIIDQDKMNEIAQIATSEALVVGKINTISVEDREIVREVRLPGDPENRMYPYLVRKVTLGVTSEMLHVTTKDKIVTDNFNETYDSEKDPRVVQTGLFTVKDAAYYEGQRARVPAIDEIINDLAEKAAKQFLQKISAHPVHFKISLQKGDAPGMKQGLDWAQNSQYSNAIQEFQKATSDPKEGHLAWFNIGVCQEAMGNYSGAMQAYEKSNQISHNSPSVESIARIRRYHPGN